MKSVAARISRARAMVMTAVSQTMKETELPAYIMAEVVANVLGDVRQTSMIELVSELENMDSKKED